MATCSTANEALEDAQNDRHPDRDRENPRAFRRDATLVEIRKELRFHVQTRPTSSARDGLDARAAQGAALRRFGNLSVIQDRGYDVRGGGVLETIVQDVKYGLRQLRHIHRSRS